MPVAVSELDEGEGEILKVWKDDIKTALGFLDEDTMESLFSFNAEREWMIQVVEKVLAEETWIFTSLCRSGLNRIIQQILNNFSVNIDMVHQRKSGIQWACQMGHSNVVKTLLAADARLNEEVWHEFSEFSLATYHGHLDVVNVLQRHKFDLLSDPEACYCLFYWSCKGGHLPLVEKWLTPGINVNREISYVSHLGDCENQYPLFAACIGGHVGVAKFLICDCGARITESVWSSSRNVVMEILEDFVLSSDDRQVYTFAMKKLNFDFVDESWFEVPSKLKGNPLTCDDTFVTKIDLCENALTSLPSKLVWHLSSVVELNLSYNPITQLPLPDSNLTLHANNVLTHLLISHCQLESLSVDIFCLQNLEVLDASYNKIEILEEAISGSKCWDCHHLRELNLSHNEITNLPSAVQVCTSLVKINLSHNRLTSLCSPWRCPLEDLDVSYNQLNTFPASCDKFWTESLLRLDASHNQLDQVYESMVKMKQLTNLDLSFNNITVLPDSSVWECPLIRLTLSDNKLGSCHGRLCHTVSIMKSIKQKGTVDLSASCLVQNLYELYLDNNNLRSLPNGLCELEMLRTLTLNGNSKLDSLPLEMGKLWNLLFLKLDGVNVQDKDIQSLIDELTSDKCHAYEFIIKMERRRRRCCPSDIFKLVVFGCKYSGGNCVVQRMTEQTKKKDKQYCNDHQTLYTYEWNLPYMKKAKTTCKRELTFRIWEFPVEKLMSVTHPCFLTQNSLYVIIHDVTYEKDKMEEVSQQIFTIQASVLQPCILVVFVFSDLMDKKLSDELRDKLHLEMKKLPKCFFADVNFSSKASWEALCVTVYLLACQNQDVMRGKKMRLVDREVPEAFIETVKRMKSMDKDILCRDEFLREFGLTLSDLQDTVDRVLKMQEYLLQTGAMLHYDVQKGNLWNLVILNPVWLYNLLKSLIEFLMTVKTRPPPINQVKQFLECQQPEFGTENFPQFISLLEIFNIALRLEESSGNECLLVPSLLADRPPELISKGTMNSVSTSRFYPFRAIPKPLWSHVISRLIPAFDRFSNPDISLPENPRVRLSKEEMRSSFNQGRSQSCDVKRLNIRNKGIQYWSTGVLMWYANGLIVVEEVQNVSPESSKGILVTVKISKSDYGSFEKSGDADSSHREDVKKLAIIGVVTDELDEIIELFDPAHNQEYETMVLCPHCHIDIQPGQNFITEPINHFVISACAEIILWERTIFCGHKYVFLESLMPEYMFRDLPDKFYIKHDQLMFSQHELGTGVSGIVSKGCFKERDVAIKSFYTPSESFVYEREYTSEYANVGTLQGPSTARLSQLDGEDTTRRKIYSKFLELRKEVSILSKLKHKCIIEFVGVCVERGLYLVLELAPLGSFRSQLQIRKESSNFLPQKPTIDKPALITKSIFGKDLTFKILLQVTSGLSYLHKQKIIFRDLKPDNILVMSLELEAEINVKVTDYGISTSYTSMGVTGFVGTPCYMAPEVVKETYTNKVDVYSLGIVMFETLTGVAPGDVWSSNKPPMMSEIVKASTTQPAHIKMFKVKCNFPFLERLMEQCWSYHMDDRPTVNEVIRKMSHHQFLLLHDVLSCKPFPRTLKVTCVFASYNNGRSKLWICESGIETSSRYLSAYDVNACIYSLRRKKVEGRHIIAMTEAKGKICFISEGSKDLEEINIRYTHNKLEIVKVAEFKTEPLSLSSFQWSPSQAEEKIDLVLVGDAKGKVTVFNPQTKHESTISLERGVSVSVMVNVSSDCVVAAAGNAIHLIAVECNSVQSNAPSHKASLIWSFSFDQTYNIKENINALIPSDANCLWCSFQKNNRIIRFSLEERRVVDKFVLSYNFKKDLVKATYSYHPVLSCAIQDGICTSLMSVNLSPNLSCSSPMATPLRKDSSPVPTCLSPHSACSSPVPIPSPLKGNGSLPRVFNFSPDKNHFLATMQLASSVTNILSDAPNLPQIKSCSSPMLDHSTSNSSPTTPRFPHNLSPNRSPTLPPSLPPRRSTLSDINVTSLCQTSDVLVVGTDSEGLFLIPISSSAEEDFSCESFLLRHPTKKRLNDFNQTTTPMKSGSKTGEGSQNCAHILSVFSTGNKLVSVLGPPNKDKTLDIKSRRKAVYGDAEINDERLTHKAWESKNLAEIAVWDDLTKEHLTRMEWYKAGFVNQ